MARKLKILWRLNCHCLKCRLISWLLDRITVEDGYLVKVKKFKSRLPGMEERINMQRASFEAMLKAREERLMMQKLNGR